MKGRRGRSERGRRGGSTTEDRAIAKVDRHNPDREIRDARVDALFAQLRTELAVTDE